MTNSRKPLLDVLNGREPERRPVWLMRQAGRYLPEYRALRAKAGSFLNLCYNPVDACEVTLQPLRRFDLDAAILFSDILVVPHAMGLSLDFRENEGPVLDTVRDATGVAMLKTAGTFVQFDNVAETVSRIRTEMSSGKSLIGFCGAPWTVASYMIEGGTSKRERARAAAIEGAAWFGDLVQKLVDVSVEYLSMQVKAGAEALQIFDSWAGNLPAEQQKLWVEKPIAEMRLRLKTLHPEIPVIVFARGCGARHGEIARATSPNAVSVEQDCALGDVLFDLPETVAVQGNLAPELLLGGEDQMLEEVRRIVGSLPMRRHIFNLGHGIAQQTNPDRVTSLIAAIRAHDDGRHV